MLKLSWVAFGCAALLLTSIFAKAQTILNVTGSVQVANEFAPFIVGDVKCDKDGQIFMRLVGSDSVMTGPLVRISPDGQKTTRYNLTSVPGLTGAKIMDFAPGENGYLFVLAQDDKAEWYVAEFDSDGKYRSHARLGLLFRPKQIAAFSNGGLLIAGTEFDSTREGSRANADPFIGIFGSDGALLKRLRLAGDVVSYPAERRKKLALPAQKDKKYESAIALSVTQTGQDGRVYLMRRTPFTYVYAIGAGGSVGRIRYASPEGTIPVSLKVGQRALAIESLKFRPDGTNIETVLLDVLDLMNGRKIIQYSIEGTGPSLACFAEPDHFVFVVADNQDRLLLVQASPE